MTHLKQQPQAVPAQNGHLRRRVVLGLPAAVGAAMALPSSMASAQAQPWPTRRMTLVVPYTAGGVSDILARLVAEKLSARLGETIVIESKPGAGTLVGIRHLLGQPADGYTYLITTGGHAMATVIFPKEFNYDPLKDFTQIGVVGSGPFALVVNADVPAKTFSEFIALAKRKPGEVTMATSGVGGIDHMAGELLGYKAGVKFNQIHYRGSPEILADLLSGRVDSRLNPIPSIKQHIDSGKVRALAVSTTRTDMLPGVPAMSETVPGFNISNYYHIMAKAGIPQAATDRMSRELQAVMALPEVRDKLLTIGIEPTWGSPATQAAMQRKDIVDWTAVKNSSGISFEK